MSELFQQVELKNLEIRNRFVMAAAADNLTGEEGRVTDAHINRLVKLAKGGVGLIITGGVGVHESARSSPNSPSLARDDFIPDYKKLTRELHKYGAKVAAQLCHSGIWTSFYQNKIGREAIAPSVIASDSSYINKPFYPSMGKYHAATEEEILEVIDAFADAAYRAKIAGFDAVEIHGAHDSLLSQFLSPVTNERSDEWGGALENRCRIHCQIGRAIRKRVSDDYFVILKLGVQDGFSGGLLFEEGKKAANYAANNGFDALEISQGLQGNTFNEMVIRPVPKNNEGYFRDWCREIKTSVNVKTIMTGGLRSFDLIQEIIDNNETDLIGLCRPLIRKLDLINRWQSGDHTRASCISCNKCVLALAEGKPLACYMDA